MYPLRHVIVIGLSPYRHLMVTISAQQWSQDWPIIEVLHWKESTPETHTLIPYRCHGRLQLRGDSLSHPLLAPRSRSGSSRMHRSHARFDDQASVAGHRPPLRLHLSVLGRHHALWHDNRIACDCEHTTIPPLPSSLAG